MFISKQKKDENIAEYILYMWQIEDIVRSCNFNIEVIEENVIRKFAAQAPAKEKIKKWYLKIIASMKEENILEKGHLEELNYIMYELYFLHNSLINIFQDKKYIELHNEAMPNIQALQHRSEGSAANDVETCLIGLYGLFLLQIQRKPVSAETNIAMKTFSKLMSFLSLKYREMKTGELQLPSVIQN